MPPGSPRFWFEPSADRIILFFVALFALFILIRVIRSLYYKSIQRHHENKLRMRLRAVGLTEGPEEELLRELIERYKIRPPEQLLSSLQHFDSIASEEILRVEKERMSLTDRLDRIEFLYSIRMNAFANEPSVGGMSAILGMSEAPAPLAPGAEPVLGSEPDARRSSRREAAVATPPSGDENEETALSEAELEDLKTLLSLTAESEDPDQDRQG